MTYSALLPGRRRTAAAGRRRAAAAGLRPAPGVTPLPRPHPPPPTNLPPTAPCAALPPSRTSAARPACCLTSTSPEARYRQAAAEALASVQDKAATPTPAAAAPGGPGAPASGSWPPTPWARRLTRRPKPACCQHLPREPDATARRYVLEALGRCTSRAGLVSLTSAARYLATDTAALSGQAWGLLPGRSAGPDFGGRRGPAGAAAGRAKHRRAPGWPPPMPWPAPGA